MPHQRVFQPKNQVPVIRIQERHFIVIQEVVTLHRSGKRMRPSCGRIVKIRIHIQEEVPAFFGIFQTCFLVVHPVKSKFTSDMEFPRIRRIV